MKKSLSNVSTTEVSKEIVSIRRKNGQITHGIVFTLIVYIDNPADTAQVMDIATTAARNHPCRLIVLLKTDNKDNSFLDAELIIGEKESGAAEVVILYLNGELANHGMNVVAPFTVPDTPVVIWWPEKTKFEVQYNPIRKLADRRITTTFDNDNPRKVIEHMAAVYLPGDTDLVWTKITHFRSVITSLLDYEDANQIEKIIVSGPKNKLTSDFLAAWLVSLIPTQVERHTGEYNLEFHFSNKIIQLVLDTKSTDRLLIKVNDTLLRTQTLPAYTITNLLSEELIRLEPDQIYANSLASIGKVKYE